MSTEALTTEQLRERVEEFLEAWGMKPTRFGKEAIGDPSFVFQLRNGRDVKLKTAHRVLAFMEEKRARVDRIAS